MKFAKLLHTPEAGEGDYSKKELISLIQSAGFGCSYSSTKKKGWEKIEAKETDFIILAGGDGTVRRIAAHLLDKRLLDKKLPIALLPLGTANNIAKTLGILGSTPEEVIRQWTETNIKKFDVGRIYGLDEAEFFLESFGFGVFPELMNRMSKRDEDDGTPQDSIKTAWEVIKEILTKAQAKYCKIKIDGVEHKGNYLMVEIMNTTTIGPKLHLAPLADPADGTFDVVMISEKQRDQFIQYVESLMVGKEEVAFFDLLRAKKLEISWDGTKAHVDDQVIRLEKNTPIEIELRHGLLEFFAPDKG